jgi:ribosome-associated protein
LTSKTLAKNIAQLMLSIKGSNVVLLDLKKLSNATDYFVICSADSDTQVRAIADAIRGGMEDQGVSLYHHEGYHGLTWVILDYVDVVAHVFHKESRSFYNLDRLWSDAKRTDILDDLAMPEASKRTSTARKKPAVSAARKRKTEKAK